jgi:hypothetical protein
LGDGSGVGNTVGVLEGVHVYTAGKSVQVHGVPKAFPEMSAVAPDKNINVNFPTSDGSSPQKLFELMLKFPLEVMLLSIPICEGSEPKKEFELRSNVVDNDVRSPIWEGRVPNSLLELKSSANGFDIRPIWEGSEPRRLFAGRATPRTVETGTSMVGEPALQSRPKTSRQSFKGSIHPLRIDHPEPPVSV